MIAHPTHILKITRCGSRSAVCWLNQPAHVRKGEPKRRSAAACGRARIVEPATKAPSPQLAVLDASPLLVILHYLLKNNTAFMMGMEQVGTGAGGPPDGPKNRNLAVTPRYPIQLEVWM